MSSTRWFPPATGLFDLDLCGSSYDTKLYVYDSALALVACNDDFYSGAPCGAYVSLLEGIVLTAGETYYVVIDGYGAAAGAYTLSIESFVACDLAIPAEAVLEGEPPLVPNYRDCYNNGCEGTCMDGDPPFNWQTLAGDPQGDLSFHARSGWYPVSGGPHREIDYFYVTLGPLGSLEIVADAVVPLYVFQMTGNCANGISVVQQVVCGPCTPVVMTIAGSPGEIVMVVTMPTTFTPHYSLDPDGDGLAEYDYLLEFSGLAAGPIATESRAWGDVKALYR